MRITVGHSAQIIYWVPHCWNCASHSSYIICIGCVVLADVIRALTPATAYFPGGTSTLRFGGQMALRGAGSLLPV